MEFNEGFVIVICQIFCEKYIVRRIMEVRESWTPCFLCRSLLLSTTVLNDLVE